MLGLLTTALTIGLIVLNLIGLALAAHRVMRSYVLARVVSPMALAVGLFFVEHFVGLGSLAFAWPLATAASVWLIARDHEVIVRHWKVEAAFIVAFQWVFAWRVAFPGLVASSEKIGDLAMIMSYAPGTTLPPMDVWLPPYPFDVYYSFQHYAAALLGRIFQLGPGLTYHLAMSTLMALTITAAAGAVHAICPYPRRAALVVFAFAAGGTGVSLPIHLLMQAPMLHSSMRFIGDTATTQFLDTPLGAAVAATATASTPKLPTETFAYLISIGDYHPMLSGFYLLTVGLLAIALYEAGRAPRAALATLAATPVVCVIANAWTMPLQAAMVGAWLLYRRMQRLHVDWAALLAGGIGTAALCYPFLVRFAYHTNDLGLSLRPVRAGQHAPILQALMVLYPVLAAPLLILVTGNRRHWSTWCAGLWLLLLAGSEVVFIDDIYGGAYDRFNTTLKWWPWIQAGALLTCGAYAMRSSRRALRWGMAAVLVAVSAYSVDMGRALAFGRKVDAGRLDGAAWITDDIGERAILEFLTAQPRAIVLQRLESAAFTPAPALVLFAGQVAFMGWPSHEQLWRGQRIDIGARADEVKRFYAGEMTDAAAWLAGNRIEHVLWLKTERAMPAGTFARIQEQIGADYLWREFYRSGDFRVGVWSRKAGAFAGR